MSANPTSSRLCSWSLVSATSVVAERSGWRRILGASKPRLSAKGAHPYRKLACLEALRLATTKLTQRGTGYPSWGHPTQLRISRGSTRLIYKSFVIMLPKYLKYFKIFRYIWSIIICTLDGFPQIFITLVPSDGIYRPHHFPNPINLQ